MSPNSSDDAEDGMLGINSGVESSHFWRQFLGCIGPVLLTFSVGLTIGFSTTLLPQLESGQNIIPYDENIASWIASIAILPMAPGCLVSGWLMTRFGRKTSLCLICATILIGWMSICFADGLFLLLAGRFITGFCVGVTSPLTPVYIGEISHPKYRAFFIAILPLANALGILIVHVTGTYLNWQKTAGFCGSFPIISLFLLSFIPESPVWLLSKGCTQKGVEAFTWFRGDNKTANTELKAIVDRRDFMTSQPQFDVKDALESLKRAELIKPLSIMILFFVTSQFSGMNAVVVYCIQIVTRAIGKETNINQYLIMIVIDIIRVLMSVIACLVCKAYGRRPLCFFSGTVTAMSMIGLSLFLYFFKETTNAACISVSFLLIYISAVSVGLMPLPWIMCGEVFPAKYKGFGSGFSSATAFIACFIVVKVSPAMMNAFGEVFTFAVYGTFAMMGTTILYFILPETKGRSLQQIEDKFSKSLHAHNCKTKN